MIDILMPRLSDTMTEGAISTWLKQPGDVVAPGDALVEIETDKAVMEQESYVAGTLVEILVAEGEQATIGTPIARLDDGSEPGQTESGVAAAVGEPVPEALAEAGSEAPFHDAATHAMRTPPSTPESRGLARQPSSPLVRRLAREHGIDLASIVGTGPGGRIVRSDVEGRLDDAARTPEHARRDASVAEPTADASPSEDARTSRRVPFDATRRTIAARLTMSATTIPTFAVTASSDVGELLAIRRRLNVVLADSGESVSVNDLLVRATAIALRSHPGLNASYDPDDRGATLLHDRIHVGIAVAAEGGLVVPVVRDADRAAVTTIAAATRALIRKAAERTLASGEMRHGTFTISNLGMLGVEHFTAILDPSQGAILAVGTARPELALVDGAPVERTVMRMTLTADHRIIDGADAARFLASLTDLLEHPLRILA